MRKIVSVSVLMVFVVGAGIGFTDGGFKSIKELLTGFVALDAT